MKKFLILTLLFATLSLPANAEQPAAEEYRQMFSSGNFYLEYRMYFEFAKDISGRRIGSANLVSAGKNGSRMYRETRASSSQEYRSRSYFENTNISSMELSRVHMDVKESRLAGGKQPFKIKKWPDVMYKDGKYYRFTTLASTNAFSIYGIGDSKNVTAIVLEESNLHSPTLNPSEEWQNVRKELALPDEFNIFYWNDPLRDKLPGATAPYFNGTSKRTVEDKEYDCDQYITDIKSLAGNLIAQEVVNALYYDGKLERLQKYLIFNGQEKFVRETVINVITVDVPDSAFQIERKIKVYKAEDGNMRDLIEQPELIETLGEK